MAKKDDSNTALVPITEQFIALRDGGAGSALAVIRENLGTENLTLNDLDRIKVPTGGGKFFTIGDEATASFTGVILQTQAQRAFWAVPFDVSGGGSPPDCYSPDQITGIGRPGGDCFTCPMAQFKSARGGEGEGQACRAFRTAFLLTPESPLPYVLLVPPTSLRNFRDYLVKTLGKSSLRPIQVLTEFSLEMDKSKGGIVYGKIKPSIVRALSEAEANTVVNYAKGIMPHLQRVNQQVVEQGAT